MFYVKSQIGENSAIVTEITDKTCLPAARTADRKSLWI